jgi:hypothetical protein
LTKLASRRRRRKTIGKVVSDVERRVRVVEKRPGAKRIKRNVVTAEKIQYRSIVAKNVATDTISPTEVSFGTTTVSTTEPTENLKDGTTWVDPTTGAAKVYDTDAEDFVDLSAVDLTARASADGKNTIYRQDNEPTGGTYVTGDVWFDTNDDNKIYRYNGTSWIGFTLGNNALASISANKITAGTIDASVITVSNLDAGNITAGSMSATRISAGTISASITITSPTITGATITGGTIRTAASGTRIELTSAGSNRIDFWGSGTAQGAVSVTDYRMFIYSPASSYGGGSLISLYGDQSPTTPNGIFMTGGTSLGSTFTMSGTNISLSQGTYGIRMTNAAVVADGAASLSASALRNIRISTSAPASGDDSSTYIDGSVLLVREA